MSHSRTMPEITDQRLFRLSWTVLALGGLLLAGGAIGLHHTGGSIRPTYPPDVSWLFLFLLFLGILASFGAGLLRFQPDFIRSCLRD